MEYFCFLSQMFNYKNKLNNCFINTMAQLPFATKGFEAFANFHAYCAKWADCYACLIKEELANRVRLNIEKTQILWQHQFVRGLDETYKKGTTYGAVDLLFKFFLLLTKGYLKKSFRTY